jgi:NAD(P)-dependent dehydrogenase (short-subunit alcohol dehydrogenase family)
VVPEHEHVIASPWLHMTVVRVRRRRQPLLRRGLEDGQEPALVKSEGARIVNVASVMHRFQLKPYESPDAFLRGDYYNMGGYRACKLAVIMWTRELQRRLGGAGTELINSTDEIEEAVAALAVILQASDLAVCGGW